MARAAAAAKGYPNLNDDEWLWGGKLSDIAQTIRHGVRSTDPDTRPGSMPAFGRDGMLKRDEISAVADYTRSLSKLPNAVATGRRPETRSSTTAPSAMVRTARANATSARPT